MFIRDHEKTAFIYDDIHISYRDLMRNIIFYSSLYKIKNGERVAIISENRPEWIYAFYSVWKHGGVAVPADFALSEESMPEILVNCTPRVIFCSVKEEDMVRKSARRAGIKVKILIFENISIPQDVPFHDFTIPASGEMDDLALIMYTSGTTGRPKGVMLTYGNLSASIKSLVSMNMLRKEDVIIGLLPFYHILPLQGLVTGACVVGFTVVMMKSLAAEDILSALRKYRVTLFLGVPRLYELLHHGIMGKINSNPAARLMFRLACKLDSRSFSRLVFKKIHDSFGGNIRAYLTGGAKMDPEVMDDLWHLGFTMVEGYGATETAPLISFNPFDRVKRGSAGIPMPGTSVKITGDEIVVKGPNVMKGYYKNPEATESALRDGWYHTGDRGRVDEEGYLYVAGRMDDMIVLSNGENVNPAEVELKIMKLSPLAKEAGVTEINGQLTAFIYPDLDIVRKENINNIFEAVKTRVINPYNRAVAANRHILNLCMISGELPKTRLGKIKRYMLKDFLSSEKIKRDYKDEPSFEEYSILKNFFMEMKGVNPVKSDHIEIDLGFDSLDRVVIQTFVEKRFGISMDENIIASHPTVLSMAEFIRDCKVAMGEGSFTWSEILLNNNSAEINSGHIRTGMLLRFARFIFHRYFSIRVRGIENLPGNPFIIAANHQSYLDALILITILPEKVLSNTCFLMKGNPLRTRIVKLISGGRNIIIVNAEMDLRESLRSAAKTLEKGNNLVIFPEGTRSRTGRMQPFKRLFAILGRELKVPVVPLAIAGAYGLMPYGRVIPSRGCIEYIFCRKLNPGSMSYDTLALKTETAIRKALNGLS